MTDSWTPNSPGWQVRWEELDERFEWVRAMQGCPQDPVHHAEGDVWIHTRMVLDCLAASDAYRELAPAARNRVFWASLLHDVGKPSTTRVELGRVTSKGHSARGALLARRILWELDMPFAERESICAMVRSHQVPFFLFAREDARRIALVASQSLSMSELCLVTEVDGRGRTCVDQARLLESVELSRLYCEEQGVLKQPFDFPSASARMAYAAGDQQDPSYAPHEAFRCEMTLLSGLPGAGKDTWIRRNLPDLPVVSLDSIREELEIDPAEPQAAVVHAGREAIREHLRARQSFVYNATNLSRSLRSQVLRIARDYGARIRIVYVEAPAERLLAQNRSRERVVPEHVIDRLFMRWEVPDVTEAHEVVYVTQAR